MRCWVWVAAAILASAPAAAQVNDPPPRNFGEAMVQEAKALGTSISEYRDLAQQRQQAIARLERELAACGNCAERPRIQGELETWQRTERQVKLAESDTLSALGLGQFSSIDAMMQAMLQALQSQHDFGTTYTREKISETISDHCNGKHPVAGRREPGYFQTLFDCVKQQQPEQQFAQFKLALNYCQRAAGDNFVAVCRTPEGCEGMERCMRANSGIVALCADNQAKGVARRKLGRCFASVLHPGIFTSAGGAAPAVPPRTRAAPKQQQCENLAEAVRRLEERAAQRPADVGIRRTLENSRSKLASAECG
jgi:hypothetical protein